MIDDDDDVDEWEMTAAASQSLVEAQSPQEQRAAMIMWLRGARVQVSTGA